MYYELVKITIDAFSLMQVIIYMVMCYHSFLDFIVNNQRLVFF